MARVQLDSIVTFPGSGGGKLHESYWDNLRFATTPQTQLTVGDANGDSLVDDDDLSLLLSSWGQDVGWGQGNFNGDNIVDDDDLSLLLSSWTGSGAVPEPASALVLVVGFAVAGLRRGRK